MAKNRAKKSNIRVSATTFYFYDLETSGLSPRDSRIMQFGGQRTDMDLKPIGKLHNILIKLTEDILPDPYAVLVTGITPQQTVAEGITEAEFLKIFTEEISIPGTTFVGFNNVRFDDEFIRYMHYRNFYDPYEWTYRDGRSRWDLLDVTRMTRALRPEAIRWPKDKDNKPTNRLELLASVNKLDHKNAHDALSDAMAAIAVARLIKSKQPKLFDFLLSMRDKQKIAKLVESGQPFVYTSGKYPGEFEKTTVAVMLAKHPKRAGALVYDLRYDPTDLSDLKVDKLVEAWRRRHDDPGLHLPIKTLQYNRCPAVAPLSVLDTSSQKRLGLSVASARANMEKLSDQQDLIGRVLKAVGLMDEQQDLKFSDEHPVVDAQLYNGFFSDADRQLSRQIHAYDPGKLLDFLPKFYDKRLKALLPLYKARNFPASLTDAERIVWEQYKHDYLITGGNDSRLARYFAKLEELKQQSKLTDKQTHIIEELRLYGKALFPEN